MSPHKGRAPRKAQSAARRAKRAKPQGVRVRVVAGTKVAPLMQLVNVYLNVEDANRAADFYEQAFGFKKKLAMPGPDGRTIHAELLHGDCTVMIGQPDPASGWKTPKELGGSPTTTYVYVKDVDALARQARAAGATIRTEPKDEYWGDRVCHITDPDGHNWYFATHQRIVPPEEMHP